MIKLSLSLDRLFNSNFLDAIIFLEEKNATRTKRNPISLIFEEESRGYSKLEKEKKEKKFATALEILFGSRKAEGEKESVGKSGWLPIEGLPLLALLFSRGKIRNALVAED